MPTLHSVGGIVGILPNPFIIVAVRMDPYYLYWQMGIITILFSVVFFDFHTCNQTVCDEAIFTNAVQVVFETEKSHSTIRSLFHDHQLGSNRLELPSVPPHKKKITVTLCCKICPKPSSTCCAHEYGETKTDISLPKTLATLIYCEQYVSCPIKAIRIECCL